MTPDVHTLTGAYALDALPEDEQREFEEHLAQCEACQREVTELQATASRLGGAVEETPPPGLRNDVLLAIDETRQERPEPTVVQMPRRSGWTRWLAAPAAAVVVILVVGLGVALNNVNGRVDELEARSGAVTDVLTADSVEIREIVVDRTTARVVAAPSRGEAAFFASGMDRAPDEQTYQLWLMADGEATPAGLFQPDENGEVIAVMTGDVASADAIGVTVEPASGSPQPTSDPIMVVEL